MIKAYAKINLGLNVLKKLENGYHSLEMLNIKVSLSDEILIEESINNIIQYENFNIEPENDLIFKFINDLTEKYKKLPKQIIAEKVKKALETLSFKGMGTVSALQQQAQTLEQISDLFFTALEEAQANRRQNKNTAEQGGVEVRYSRSAEEEYAEYDKPITVTDVKILRTLGKKHISDFTHEDLTKAKKWYRIRGLNQKKNQRGYRYGSVSEAAGHLQTLPNRL